MEIGDPIYSKSFGQFGIVLCVWERMQRKGSTRVELITDENPFNSRKYIRYNSLVRVRFLEGNKDIMDLDEGHMEVVDIFNFGVIAETLRSQVNDRLRLVAPYMAGVLKAVESEVFTLDKLMKYYNGTCQLCLKKKKKKDMAIEHIFPQAKGASEHLSNIALVCKKCNTGSPLFKHAGPYIVSRGVQAKRKGNKVVYKPAKHRQLTNAELNSGWVQGATGPNAQGWRGVEGRRS